MNVLTTVGLVLLAASAPVQGRETLTLDGEWAFGLDREDAGEAGAWFGPEKALDGVIHVPGAWDAQGYGDETERLHHHFIGKGWYKRTAAIPAAWKGSKVFLRFGGVHRYAKVWVNGQFLGEHIGYLSPFEFDVTSLAAPGSEIRIAVCVDSKQRWDVDALLGCFDIIDYMDTYWGGLWGHVTLERRANAHLEELFVQPRVSPAGCRVSAMIAGDRAAADGALLEVVDAGGKEIVREKAALNGDGVSVSAEMAGAALWTPNAPVLYTARLSLLKSGQVIDQVETRFGLREIAIEGTHLLLNGKRIFLHGYGDDCVYPETMAAPLDKEVYLKRLRVAKEYGFNHVRHHSHMLPDEYYDACDEVGMLVSAEFPIGYPHFFEKATEAALELYKSEWAAAIKRHRNHPSIFDWSMGNEMWEGTALAPEMYRIAKGLDPTRPVVDSDGVWAAGFVTGEKDRDTLDFYFTLFDCFRIPLDIPDKFRCPSPLKPVVSHETGNYTTFPRFDLIDRFEHNIKPFWLTTRRARMEQLGLLDEAELWADNSERLYLLCHKLNMESLRMNPNIVGHHWWLLQDYWTTTNGLVDLYFRPKPELPPEKVRRFNADVVLLQEGLRQVHRGGEQVAVTFSVSNYAPEVLRDGKLTWRLTAGNEPLAEVGRAVALAPQGEVTQIGRAVASVPEVQAPTQLLMKVELEAGGQRYRNDWTAWVYPGAPAPARLEAPVYASAELLGMFAPYGAEAFPSAKAWPGRAVYVGSFLSTSMSEAMARGACVLLVQPPVVMPSAAAKFKTAWWKARKGDCDVGTVAYDHPVTRGMAPEGWCDAGWYRLIQGCQGYILDDLPARPNVIVRGIELMEAFRNKALLCEMKVGKGSLIVCGLNLDAKDEERPAPEAAWLTAKLLEYASGLPQPEAELPVDYFTQRAAEMPQFAPPLAEGFAQLLRNEGEDKPWITYREDRGPTYTCRQTAAGHAVTWESAALPETLDEGGVTFVFAGGVGWVKEPEGEGFTLTVNGEDVLKFNVALGFNTWRNDERGVVMSLFPRRMTDQDNVGLFYLRVPAAMLEAGKPCTLSVRSNGPGSQRWFALHPYVDVLQD